MAKYKVAPLSNGIMLAGLLGLLISIFFLYGRNPSWGFTLGLFSGILVISSLISMTYAPVLPEKKKR